MRKALIGISVAGDGDGTMDIRKHAFPAIVDETTRVLILGSLPGERSLAERRYYAHPQNQFWRLVGVAIDAGLAALPYDARLEMLRAAGIGLWDVVATARRAGSTDAAIRDPAANDIAALADRLPDLRAIAFNGAKALAIGRPLIGERPIAILALPSSSPLHTIGIAAKQPAWCAIAAHLTLSRAGDHEARAPHESTRR